MTHGQKEAYFRRFFWILLSIIGSVEFVRGAIFIALVPSYVPHHLKADVLLSGGIISAMYGADTLAKPSAGWLVDFFGPRPTLLLSLPCALIGLSTFFWSTSGLVLIFGAILFGLGCAPVWPAVLSTLVELSPRDEKAKTLSTIYMIWLAGIGSGVVLISILYRLIGPNILLLALFAVFCLPIILAFNIRKWISKQRISRKSGAGRHLMEMLREIWKFRVLLPGALAQTMALSMLVPLMQRFTEAAYGLTQAGFGLMILLGGIITVILLVPVGKMVDQFGYLPFLVTGFFMAGLLLLAVSRYPNHLLIYPYAILLGIAYCFILPSWNGLLAQLLPSSVRASLYSIIMSIEGLGVAVGPVLGGKLTVDFGYRFTFGVSSIILFVMAIFYLVLRYPAKHVPDL